MPTFIPYFIGGEPNTSRLEAYIDEEDWNNTPLSARNFIEELGERIDETNQLADVYV